MKVEARPAAIGPARLDAAFAENVLLHGRVREMAAGPILEAAREILSAVRRGGKVLSCGNGGSAADAQHFAGELVGRFQLQREALPEIALTTDTSVLTSLGNDYGFDHVFARQVQALGREGDVLLAISTSGGSRNVLEAVAAARALGVRTIGLTGRDGGQLGRTVDVHVNVPSDSTARTQEVHVTILHVLCELVETEVAGMGKRGT
jgi:phosphoheptose isomerase